MTGLDEVLDRLATDAAYRDLVRTDPAAALRSVELSTAELTADELRVLDAALRALPSNAGTEP